MAKIERYFNLYSMTHDKFKMLALLSAAMIIRECEKFQPNGELSNYPEDRDTALGILYEYVNWASHGFINALQSHVELVFAYQEAVIDKKFFAGPDFKDALLINKSLEIYQKWKDDIVKRENVVYGEKWGDASGFNTAKWNKNNEKFLMLYKR